jgi:2',3'-cyclic-nucleotide 2'-phosphodiesterase (5'-nucleotidase family)
LAGSSSLTLLYTANLAGDIWLLPRLFTLIQRERRMADGPVVLLDLGDTCSMESWVCRVTYGRAPFIVLDGMGYDAVFIGGPEQVPIPPASLLRLLDTIVMPVIVWNSAWQLTKHGITFALVSGSAQAPDDERGVRVDRSRDTLPGEGDAAPILGDVTKGHLARVDLVWPDWIVQAARVIPLSDDVPPDPIITATVEFVESEARAYAQQQGGVL